MYKQILVPVDLNDQGFSDKALSIAIWHAKHGNAELHLLTVVPGIHMSMVATYFPQDAALKMKQDILAQLRSFARRHMDDNMIYHLHVTEGKPSQTIVEFANKLGADLIIMPSHKHSKIDRMTLGSVASKVVQSSPIQVLVVKPQG